jgi:hypothetical protein
MGKVKEIFLWMQFHKKIGGFETSTQICELTAEASEAI